MGRSLRRRCTVRRCRYRGTRGHHYETVTLPDIESIWDTAIATGVVNFSQYDIDSTLP